MKLPRNGQGNVHRNGSRNNHHHIVATKEQDIKGEEGMLKSLLQFIFWFDMLFDFQMLCNRKTDSIINGLIYFPGKVLIFFQCIAFLTCLSHAITIGIDYAKVVL